MSRLLCINAVGAGNYATLALNGGLSAVDRVRAYAEAVPDVGRIVALTRTGDQRLFPFETVELNDLSGSALVDQLALLSDGYEEIVYVFGDTPFLDLDLTVRMLSNHRRYFAEYSFADGYPSGLAPEIVASSVLPLFRRLCAEETIPLDRETLFTIVQKDINSFDIETEISPVDLRSLRLSLTCDNRRNYLLCRKIAETGNVTEEGVLQTVNQQGQILRTLPAYVNIQIIDGCPQACSYCPFPLFGGDILTQRNEMPFDVFLSILDKVEKFAPESTISLSLWGEPSLHSRIADMIIAIHGRKSLSLNVETSGIGWRQADLDRLSESGLDRIEWIVSLDSSDPELYRSLRGPGFDESVSTVNTLLGQFPGHVHVQAVRMNENEEHLEEFYHAWKERAGNVIIQKYDHFAGLLPQRKVTDLSPLKRQPCWHLKRDLIILLDGTVGMCREDVERKESLGNVINEDLETIWERGESIYALHLQEQYPEICRTCDEYYTYNY